MKIVINSHRKSDIALNHLLRSMQQQKEFAEFQTIIVVGGFYENEEEYVVETTDYITKIKSKHNSIDFTGLICLLELYGLGKDENETYVEEEEYYFYMHDTCRIGKRFYEKLKEINMQNRLSMRLNVPFSMNMGVYSQTVINQFRDFLLSKKNPDENRLFEFKTVDIQEDYIFRNDLSNFTLNNYDNSDGKNVTKRAINFYGTGTLRIVEYYPDIDLYKMKANWGQGKWTLDN